MKQSLSIIQPEPSSSARTGHPSVVIAGSGFLLGGIMSKYKRHGLSNHPLYYTRNNMFLRCYNTNSKYYKDYGGRGITVCKEWRENPKSFIEWALAHGWEKGLNLDRIDNDKGYFPENCRFVNNGLNTRNSRLLWNTNTSGYRGVSFHKRDKTYQAQIGINGKLKHLGSFNDPMQAAIAYDSMAIVLDDGRPTNFKWPN